jgi:hypothetical protein
VKEAAMHLAAAQNGFEFVAAIVLSGIFFYFLRIAVIGLNNAERYYSALVIVLVWANLRIAILMR